MRFFKRENKTRELMDEHVEIVSKATDHCRDAFFFYLEGEKKKFEAATLAVIQSETRADEVRKETQLLLYGGTYLPIFREDLLELLELIDNVADDAEKAVDFLRTERPKITPSWHGDLRIIVDKTHQSFVFFKEAFSTLRKERSITLSYTHKVQEAEKDVDKLQDALMAKIFQSKLGLAHKMQLRDLILVIGYVSDSSENASDKVGLMAIKGRV